MIVLAHVAIQVADVEASADFYTATFAALGVHEVIRVPRGDTVVVGLAGPNEVPRLWLGPVDGSGAPAREVHIALLAPHQQAVDDVHDAALVAGVEILHAPRLWPEYFDGYYAVFLRDPDGNNVEAMAILQDQRGTSSA